MVHVSAIDANRAINTKAATYNAVKIQVNEPQTTIPEGFKSSPDDNGVYNAVSIEVNRPSVKAGANRNHGGIYDYPCANCPVTSDFAPIHNVRIPEMPVLPVAYQTTNFINNRTLINAEVEVENDAKKAAHKSKEEQVAPQAEIVYMEEIVAVPAPKLTTTEAEKAKPEEISFHGISFKAAGVEKQVPEIIAPEDIKPLVDIPKTLSNLSSSDYDVQAKQMEEIARVSMKDPQKAVPYIVTEIFNELINIVEKDTKGLTPPSEKQIETRKQIIVNEIVKEQAKAKGLNPKEVELPYKINEKDLKAATNLSTLEQAERNKEYALYTMAILAKVYTDEVHRHTGNVVPLTDLPGVSSVVDTLRNSPNAGVKIAAIDAIRYINRPEYKEELASILDIATNDKNPYVARNAAVALESFN